MSKLQRRVIMKRKVIYLFTMVFFVFTLTACKNSGSNNDQNNSTAAVNTVQSSASDTADNNSIESSESIENGETESQDTLEVISDIEAAPVSKSLNEVADYLVTKKVVSGEQTDTAAEMIGAISGFKYLDSNVEVYEYDTDSDVYKEIVKDNIVKVQGLDLKITVSAINGKYVLFCDDAKNKDDIIGVFKEIK
jgi:hypothetical protein